MPSGEKKEELTWDGIVFVFLLERRGVLHARWKNSKKVINDIVDEYNVAEIDFLADPNTADFMPSINAEETTVRRYREHLSPPTLDGLFAFDFELPQ